MTGGASSQVEALDAGARGASRFAWVSTQPLGGPVVPGGVDDGRGILGRDAAIARVGDAVGPPAARSSASVIAPSASPSITTTCSSAGSASRTRRDLRRLLGVLDEHDLRARVPEHVLALLGRVRVVDRHDGRAGAERAEVGQRPLRPRPGRGSPRGRRARRRARRGRRRSRGSRGRAPRRGSRAARDSHRAPRVAVHGGEYKLTQGPKVSGGGALGEVGHRRPTLDLRRRPTAANLKGSDPFRLARPSRCSGCT